MAGLRTLDAQPLASSLRSPTAWAARWIGLPFKPLGRDWKGCDCWGLFRLVYAEEFGIDLASYDEGYSGTSLADFDDLSRLISGAIGMRDRWIRIEPGQERVGDGIALLISGKPFHVGVVIGGRKMLVTEEAHDACTESYVDLKWKNRVGGFYRWSGADA